MNFICKRIPESKLIINDKNIVWGIYPMLSSCEIISKTIDESLNMGKIYVKSQITNEHFKLKYSKNDLYVYNSSGELVGSYELETNNTNETKEEYTSPKQVWDKFQLVKQKENEKSLNIKILNTVEIEEEDNILHFIISKYLYLDFDEQNKTVIILNTKTNINNIYNIKKKNGEYTLGNNLIVYLMEDEENKLILNKEKTEGNWNGIQFKKIK